MIYKDVVFELSDFVERMEKRHDRNKHVFFYHGELIALKQALAAIKALGYEDE